MENNSQENNRQSTHQQNATPWEHLRLKPFSDGVLKTEFSERKLRLPEGDTWIRILPEHSDSAYGWMFGISALEYDGGRFAHPRTVRLNAVSAFDHSLKWLKQNYPHMLRSPDNPTGIRLWPRELGVCWVIVQENGNARLRLLLASAFRGGRSGPPGLAHQLWQASCARNEDGTLAHNFVERETGSLICVRKKSIKGHPPLYHVIPGRRPAPVDEQLARLDEDERNIWCPLETTIEPVTEDEEWRYLGKSLSKSTVTWIKTSLKRGS